jgi:hypothetical protein
VRIGDGTPYGPDYSYRADGADAVEFYGLVGTPWRQFIIFWPAKNGGEAVLLDGSGGYVRTFYKGGLS